MPLVLLGVSASPILHGIIRKRLDKAWEWPRTAGVDLMAFVCFWRKAAIASYPCQKILRLSRLASMSARVFHTGLICFFENKGNWSSTCLEPGLDQLP